MPDVSSELPPLPLIEARWDKIASQLGLKGKLKLVAELILREQCDKQIEARLSISHGTLRTYISRIFDRLKTNSRAGVIIRILAHFGRNSARYGQHRG